MTTVFLGGACHVNRKPRTPDCEKYSQRQQFLGSTLKTLMMVLPRRQYIAASVFFASTIQVNPSRHQLPRVVRGNIVSGFCCYLRPTLIAACTKPPNIILDVAVTTTAAVILLFHRQYHDHHPPHVSLPLPTISTTHPCIRLTLYIRARCETTTSATSRHGRHTSNMAAKNKTTIN